MLVLGIDPGTARTGYGLVRENESGFEVLGYGCITTDLAQGRGKRLEILHREVSSLIRRYKPDIVVQELLFFNKNIRTALLVGEARGVILLAAAQAKVPVTEYTPLQIKESLAGYGRATKKQIGELVRLCLGLEEPVRTDDASDALAIALCHFALIRL